MRRVCVLHAFLGHHRKIPANSHDHSLRCVVRASEIVEDPLDLILSGTSGRLVCVRNGVYNSVPIDVITGRKKVVDLGKHYNVDRLRPVYKTLIGQPLFVMTSDV